MAHLISRRIRMMLLAAVFGLLATACGGGTDTTSSDAATPAAASEESASEESANEPTTDESTAEAESDEVTAPDEPQPAADAGLFGGEFVDLNGETIDLASFEGQDVVLWFWAPW